MDNAKFRFLIVEDEPATRTTVEECLQRLGYALDATGEPGAALQLARKNAYRLVFCGARVGGTHGPELLAAARQLQPNAQLVLITACDAPERRDPIQAGAYSYVCKPIDPQRLRLVVTKALEFEDVLSENNQLRQRVGPAAALDPAQPPACEIRAGMTVSQCEELLIRHTLAHVTTNRARAARLLGISRRTLQYKLKDYGLLSDRRPQGVGFGEPAV